MCGRRCCTRCPRQAVKHIVLGPSSISTVSLTANHLPIPRLPKLHRPCDLRNAYFHSIAKHGGHPCAHPLPLYPPLSPPATPTALLRPPTPPRARPPHLSS